MRVIPAWALAMGWIGVWVLAANLSLAAWSWGVQPMQVLHRSAVWRSYLKQEGWVGFAIACSHNRACSQQYRRLQPPLTPRDVWRLWPLALVLWGFSVKQPTNPHKAPGAARWATRQDLRELYHERLPPP